jgi:predicted metal-dependent hydrolase
MPEVISSGTTIRYEVVRSRRRTLGIEITPECEVVVRAPFRAADWRIRRLVSDKSAWILKHIQRISQVQVHREFTSGEPFPYRGVCYPLRIGLNGALSRVEIIDGQLMAMVAPGDNDALKVSVRVALYAWYFTQSRNVLSQRTTELATWTGLMPARLGIRNQVHRWGSCSAKNCLNLNWKLIMAPPEVADYVILHELCHIKEHNHSRAFWELLSSFVPDCKERRKWHRENGASLDL